ncbi:signal peptidase I [Pimelobacter simplex]|uniref:signal peptidase I n=1 Tax=Nocardioides simplex TaxID=2045 RepID=UPI0038277862
MTTSVENEIRTLAAVAGRDTSAPVDLAARALRGARRTRRRRTAIAAGVVAVGLGVSWGAGRIGVGPYYDELQPSAGMAPTIAMGESVTFHRDLVAEQGDVVRISVPGVPVPLLTRVIAVGGMTVSCPARPDGTCAGVLVDGRPSTDDYLAALPSEPFAAVDVPTGDVFVLSDNRARAVDSRVLGPVAASGIEGVAVAVRRDDSYVAIPGAPRHAVPGDADPVDPVGPVPPAGDAPAD